MNTPVFWGNARVHVDKSSANAIEDPLRDYSCAVDYNQLRSCVLQELKALIIIDRGNPCHFFCWQWAHV